MVTASVTVDRKFAYSRLSWSQSKRDSGSPYYGLALERPGADAPGPSYRLDNLLERKPAAVVRVLVTRSSAEAILSDIAIQNARLSELLSPIEARHVLFARPPRFRVEQALFRAGVAFLECILDHRVGLRPLAR